MNNTIEVLLERMARIRQILDNAKMNPNFEQIDAIYNLTEFEHENN